jgi:TRAP-type mannitol/chloroaromatic compound transport system substrate-binding protein
VPVESARSVVVEGEHGVLSAETYLPDGTLENATYFAYDEDGLTLERRDIYTYESMGNVVTDEATTVYEYEFDDAGNLSVEGLKLRGNAVYNAFFTNYLGAQVIDLPTTEVYSALERGVVDATGWTQIGLIDLKWNEFLNYRIEPCFFSTDLGVIVNLDRWDSLSDEARTILQDVAIQHEKDSVAALREKRDADFAALEEQGMQVVELEGEARANYLAAAREKTWERMRGLMAEHPMGDGMYDALIAKFYDPEADK